MGLILQYAHKIRFVYCIVLVFVNFHVKNVRDISNSQNINKYRLNCIGFLFKAHRYWISNFLVIILLIW